MSNNSSLIAGLIGGTLLGAGVAFVTLTYEPKAIPFWHLTDTSVHIGKKLTPTEQAHRPDMQFIEILVPLNRQMIAIANYTQTHGQHPQLKALAREISDQHQTEVDNLKQWYKAWYEKDLELPVSGEAFVKLNIEGATTDEAFIRKMIQHNQMTIKVASMVVDSAQKPEIRSLAQSIINNQTDEMSRLMALLQ